VKLCLVAHGYPPELVGGTEKSVQSLAHAFARRGHAVSVVAGSMEHEQGFRTSEATDDVPGADVPVRVHRIHRADLYFDHWQKSAHPGVTQAFRAFLAEERPDVVHVHHWIRLSRDLVQAAAREGVPAVVTLHDLWTTCLVTFRVRPDTQVLCDAPLAPSPCLRCAGGVPPRTPWVPFEEQAMELGARRADLVSELTLARAVLAPSRAHADAVARFLGVPADDLALRVLPHGRDLTLAPRAPLPAPRAHGRLVLGAWGHLHPLKGPDVLLDALEELRDLPVTLRLAGGEVDAAFAAELRTRAAELTTGAGALEVEFFGAFAEAELASHPVTEVHLMVSGTRALESWGLVIDEAAALGVPMILPRAGAFPERLAEGVGALFYTPADAADLARALRRVWEEPALLGALRAGLPPAARLVPDVATHAESVEEVYAAAVAAGPPPVEPEDWWRTRMQRTRLQAWDDSLRARSAEDLGFA